jgi:hypothetical protein
MPRSMCSPRSGGLNVAGSFKARKKGCPGRHRFPVASATTECSRVFQGPEEVWVEFPVASATAEGCRTFGCATGTWVRS